MPSLKRLPGIDAAQQSRGAGSQARMKDSKYALNAAWSPKGST